MRHKKQTAELSPGERRLVDLKVNLSQDQTISGVLLEQSMTGRIVIKPGLVSD